MPPPDPFSDLVKTWAMGVPSVRGLTLIGSRERAAGDALWRPDLQSDWDFQIITSNPRMFAVSKWVEGLSGATLRVYAARSTRVGKVPKVNAVFDGLEADFVIVPAGPLRLARILVAWGLHRREGWLRRGLRDLAVVIRPGWRFLKGAADWEPFYRRVVAEIDDPRLGDEAARRLADGFACDYVWTVRKLERGELRSAQRMLHRELAEVNFRLLHELKLRRGERSFPEGRRIERAGTEADLNAVTVSAACDGPALAAALERSAASCRELMRALVGESWRWPQLRNP